ncbi:MULTISPECIES: YhgE/Pip domain-containing protein [unclassified Saccharopolyspora]|uniref:YhgE/Pip domain-containing protein n=1 Tax=unclassified Saccharopolyspora TaxID=2646250 RepID=UPI001CD51AC3|nr:MULTISPECIES: YhgE/Pip domain-containing protein [unclassified Saccharopolyspora]MCA1195094.1 YhgE/Pip domain-containing protein [Saccharopolyspora sp. 6V]MCA1224614.1 YhgE/Pip domain-containing protein [Saccharopolyspora sp. 6M]
MAKRRLILPLIGLLLVPLAIAGLLIWSLGKPEDRLKDVKAAVVNNDEPVEVNGQLTPLGRQLSAKLVGGEIESNYSWEFATPQTAAEGLADGSYAAVVTIPENFSAAATSFSGDPAQAKKATIDVSTGGRSKFADEAISRVVTNTAADLLGRQLTTTYLDNVFVGFNTLGDKLGEASDGATSLADGAQQLAGGTDQLAGGADQLADGSRALADGIGALEGGAQQLKTGMGGLADGIGQLKEQTAQLPGQVGQLADVSAQEAQGVQQLSGGLQGMSESLAEMSKECPPGTLPICNKIAIQAATAKALGDGAGQLQQASTGVSGGLAALAGKTPESGGGLVALSGGIDQLHDGAQQLDGGVGQLADGISQTGGGAGQLADGADQLAQGVRGLSDGAHQLGDGTGQLSSGLDQAVDQLPSYPDGDRDKLAKTVANPITTAEGSSLGFGSSGIALYSVLALWVGAIATFLVLRAVPRRALESTRSSFALALRQFRLPAVVGLAQGLLVAVVVGVAQDLSVGGWFGCAGLAMLTAVAFTAVNQALAGALRGTGRFLAMLVAVVLLATGFITAVPSALSSVLAALPVGPAQDALRAVVDGSAPGGGTVVLLVIWGLAGLVVSYLAVERGRTVRATRLTGFTARTAEA